MKLPLGYSYAATYAGIRQVEKDDLALIVSGLAGQCRGGFHAEPRAGGAGAAGAESSEGVEGSVRRGGDQRGQRQLRHADRRRGGAGDVQGGGASC